MATIDLWYVGYRYHSMAMEIPVEHPTPEQDEKRETADWLPDLYDHRTYAIPQSWAEQGTTPPPRTIRPCERPYYATQVCLHGDRTLEIRYIEPASGTVHTSGYTAVRYGGRIVPAVVAHEGPSRFNSKLYLQPGYADEPQMTERDKQILESVYDIQFRGPEP